VCAFGIKPHLLRASASRDYADKRMSSSRGNQRANAAGNRGSPYRLIFSIRENTGIRCGESPNCLDSPRDARVRIPASFRATRRTVRFTALIRGVDRGEIRAHVFLGGERGRDAKVADTGGPSQWRKTRTRARGLSGWLAGCTHDVCTNDCPRRHCSRRQCIRITVTPDALNYNDCQDIR